MFSFARVVIISSLAFFLFACSNVPSKEEQGVLIGAVAGGILGNQVGGGSGRVLATMVGAIAGGAIGGSVGRSMDEQDRARMAASLENVRTGVSTSWVNPDTGYEYQMTPTRTYEADNQPCREYTMNAKIGGKTEQVYGTACRQADGSWQIVN